MRIKLWTGLTALLCGSTWLGAQELSVWRVANPADPASVGLVDAGPLDSGTSPASYHLRLGGGGGVMEAGVYLEPNSQVTAAAVAGGIRLELNSGAVVVQYAGTGGATMPLVVFAKNEWLRLGSDSLARAELAGDAVRFLLGKGRAERFTGAPPADSPAGAQGGQALTADPAVNEKARAMISALNAAGAAGRALGWIGRAESGDLAPTERFTRPSSSAYLVRTTGVVTPRTASVATPSQLAAPPTAGAFSQTQALLASQNPASVVVGARLERTRIVGNPGTTGGGIRFNTQARPPLRLGTAR